MKKFLSLLAAVSVLSGSFAAASFTDVPANHWAASYIEAAQANGLMNGTGDGRFAPDEALTLAQVCQIAYNFSGTSFAVSGEWWSPAVAYVQSRTGLTVQNPDAVAERAFVAVLLYRLDGSPAVTTTGQFHDLSWAAEEVQRAVAYCASRGIISGYDDGRFGPNDSLTRAQAAKIFAVYRGLSLTATNTTPTYQSANLRAEIADMANYAQSLGLYVEAEDRPDERDGYTWTDLRIYTAEGYFTIVGGGRDAFTWYSLNGLTNSMEVSDGEFLKLWLKELAGRFNERQKLDTAVKQLSTRLEDLGFVPEYQTGAGISYKLDPFGEVNASELSANLRNAGLVVNVSITGGGELMVGGFNSVLDYLAHAEQVANATANRDKVNLAVAFVKKLAASRGWKVEVKQRNSNDGGLWYGLRCYTSTNAPYYQFVIGGKASVYYYNEANGQSTLVDRASVKQALMTR